MDKFVFPDPPNLSYYLYRNIKSEIFHFPSSPLYDSLDHEDVVFHHLEFSDRGCRGIFIHSFEQNSDLSTVDLSKPPIFDDPSSDELETPQAIEALKPKLMVMSGSRSLDVSSTSNQKYVELFQDPYHSIFYSKNQSISQFLHPPTESCDPIAQGLEELYVASTFEK